MEIFNILSAIPIFTVFEDASLNWIGKIISWLVGIAGSVGVGIILFTLALKLITLPLDIYSKAAMRKNSLKMERMRPELEKLKKQYEHDKMLYSQKMQALYKKEGYSMFGACLPTIVTLVFFIVVLNAFQAYSRFTTLTTFNDMRYEYTSTILSYTAPGEEFEREDLFEIPERADNVITLEKVDALIAAGRLPQEFAGDADRLNLATDYIIAQARIASANTFKDADQSFLWVKNIWISDSAFSHPVQSYSKFISTVSLPKNKEFTQSAYNELTANLNAQRKQPNGYFIFIILSVGITVLSQWILGKSQKAQLELQSVDGQGAKTQKMMMIIMPIMIGVFAFMYTSAFCIYMVTNSALTILSTLLINKIVDVRFSKKLEAQEEESIKRKYSRVEGAKPEKSKYDNKIERGRYSGQRHNKK